MNRSSFFKNATSVPCYWCARLLTYAEATKEHLIPRSHGGTDTVGNIKIACSDCNNERGHITQLSKMAQTVLTAPKKVKAWRRFVKHYHKWEAIRNKWEDIHKKHGIKLELYRLRVPKKIAALLEAK